MIELFDAVANYLFIVFYFGLFAGVFIVFPVLLVYDRPDNPLTIKRIVRAFSK